MRVLVVADDEVWRRAAINTLRCDAICATESAMSTACELVKVSPPDVLVLRWPDADGTRVLQAICCAQPHESMFVLVVLGDEPDRTLGTALAAGAHDVVRERYFLDEVRARIDARARLSRWMLSVVAANAEQQNKLATLRAWRHFDRIVADELSAMLGTTLDLSPSARPVAKDVRRGATLTITFAAERYVLAIHLGADDATLARLATMLLGNPHADEDAKRDLLREMANAAGGAVKRAALPEKARMTLGLPCDADGQVADAAARAWTLCADGISILVSAGLHARGNESVPAAKLREGMVIAKDVRVGSGMLLVAGGTRLTMTTASRLAQMIGERTLVEISDAA